MFKSNKNGNIYYSVQTSTRSYPCFTQLYNTFYPNGIKVVPNDIFDLLTPISLAYWAMDDGSISKEKYGFLLHTQGFTLQEVILLINVLKIKFDLDCTAQKSRDKYLLYIKSQSIKKFIKLVKPYFQNSAILSQKLDK